MKKVIQVFAFILLMIGSQGLTAILSGQNIDKLPRNTPESAGVSSAGIIDFLNAVDTGRVELHSFMFLRHGTVISEGWWSPYGPDYKHILASVSKTFTATAIGLAVYENRLKITDKVISFFPNSLPDTISENMKELTVEHLLTMSVGQDQTIMGAGSNEDWITAFFKIEPVYKQGTVFKYNNMATFMLSAIVQQVTDQTVFDYLQPRIFKPLGIRGADWDLSPQGINMGMAGLRLRTEDLAKFGKLLIQNGVWNEKQLIPKEWIKEATSFKIESSDPNNKRPKNLNDWAQGYCYQMWRGRNNTVRLDGAGGQYVILIPDKDAVVVFTANAMRNSQDELDLLHNYLIPSIKSDKALPANPSLNTELRKKEAALSLKPSTATGLSKSEIESKISGKEFDLSKNNNNIKSVYFSFNDKECSFAIKRDDDISIIKARPDRWQMSGSFSSFLLAPPQIAPKSVDVNYKILQPVIKVGARYTWIDKNTLELTARSVEESFVEETIICRFSENDGIVNVLIEQKDGGFPSGIPIFPARLSTPLRGALIKTE